MLEREFFDHTIVQTYDFRLHSMRHPHMYMIEYDLFRGKRERHGECEIFILIAFHCHFWFQFLFQTTGVSGGGCNRCAAQT